MSKGYAARSLLTWNHYRLLMGAENSLARVRDKIFMRYKAILLDFYGTLVTADDEVIKTICTQLTSSDEVRRAFGNRWFQLFAAACHEAHGDDFRSQRTLAATSLSTAMQEFSIQADPAMALAPLYAYWQQPSGFAESHQFLAAGPLPICIVSNIDNDDIVSAADHHGWHFQSLVTSEVARAYKPRAEIFVAALGLLKLTPRTVLHVGDSLSADIRGAQALGMDTAWINRTHRPLPAGQSAPTFIVSTLLDLHEQLNNRGS